METFSRYWAFVTGLHLSPVHSPLTGQWREALMFSLMYTWTDGWANSPDAGDLWLIGAHCDVTVMLAHYEVLVDFIHILQDYFIGTDDDVIKWKHFPRHWPFFRGIHRPPINSPHKGEWRGALMFSLIYAWINGWLNTREAGDLRRHRAHYYVTVMGAIVWSPQCQWPLLLTWFNFNPSMDK